MGAADWVIDEEILEKWGVRTTEDSDVINFDCPARRIMNTLDYKDVKVGIYSEYRVFGFYILE
jgi:hypothetical protein